MADTSSIKRRLIFIEKHLGKMARLIHFLARKFGRGRRVNNYSRALTEEETTTFNRTMAAHGVPDPDEKNQEEDDSSSSRTNKGVRYI